MLVTDKHTWFSLLYMVIQFVLGIIYFVVLVTILALSLSGIAIPILQEVFHLPVVSAGSMFYYVPTWGYPLVILAGILLLTITMHIVKFIGQLHGRYAKALLVTE